MLDLRSLVDPSMPKMAHIKPAVKQRIKTALENKLNEENVRLDKGIQVHFETDIYIRIMFVDGV